MVLPGATLTTSKKRSKSETMHISIGLQKAGLGQHTNTDGDGLPEEEQENKGSWRSMEIWT